MKGCPTCQRTYSDDEMRFCLEDGTSLISVPSGKSGDATWIMPAEQGSQPPPAQASPAQPEFRQIHPSPPPIQPASSTQPEPRKRSPLLWILAALVLGLSGIVVIALILNRAREDENPLTARTSTPTPTPTPAPASSPTNNYGKTASVSTPTPLSSPTARQMNTNNLLAEASPTPPKPTPTPTPKPSLASAPTVPSEPINGEVLNGKALSLPKPPYPPLARRAHIAGLVVVRVMVDENGSVISARAVSGHPLLQAAAVQAAREARFSPTKLSGQPVKVTGVIKYNFVAQ